MGNPACATPSVSIGTMVWLLGRAMYWAVVSALTALRWPMQGSGFDSGGWDPPYLPA